MSPENWELLRHETRPPEDIYGPTGPGCFAGPALSPFHYYPADLTLAGIPYPDGLIRKRGFQGSLSTVRPALHLKLHPGPDGEERRFDGHKKVVLSNAIQDPSYLRQCLAYATFRRANVPAPRCQLAAVAVNEEPLGVYVHVERIDKPFLGRWFADNDGLLYEGTLADFAPGWIDNFEHKGGEGPEHALLGILHAADLAELNAGIEGAAVAALDAVIDVEAFVRYWVVESFLIDADGYPAAANNYRLYFDPQDDRAHFIPWGTDLTFASGGPVAPESFPAVIARGRLARLLLGDPSGRALYRETMMWFLQEVWDEERALDEAASLHELVLEHLAPSQHHAARKGLEEVEALISTRADAVRARLASPLPHAAQALGLPCLADDDTEAP